MVWTTTRATTRRLQSQVIKVRKIEISKNLRFVVYAVVLWQPSVLSPRAGTLYSFLERLHNIVECASEKVFHVQIPEQVCTEIPFLEHGIRVRIGTMRANYVPSNRENVQATKERERERDSCQRQTKEHGTCSGVWFGILLIVVDLCRLCWSQTRRFLQFRIRRESFRNLSDTANKCKSFRNNEM